MRNAEGAGAARGFSQDHAIGESLNNGTSTPRAAHSTDVLHIGDPGYGREADRRTGEIARLFEIKAAIDGGSYDDAATLPEVIEGVAHDANIYFDDRALAASKLRLDETLRSIRILERVWLLFRLLVALGVVAVGMALGWYLCGLYKLLLLP